jgi:hypothetical protein
MSVIYIIEVLTLGGLYPVSHINQEAYDSYEKAKRFIESRSDRPIKKSDYEWKSEDYKYTILTLNVI